MRFSNILTYVYLKSVTGIVLSFYVDLHSAPLSKYFEEPDEAFRGLYHLCTSRNKKFDHSSSQISLVEF